MIASHSRNRSAVVLAAAYSDARNFAGGLTVRAAANVPLAQLVVDNEKDGEWQRRQEVHERQDASTKEGIEPWEVDHQDHDDRA